MYQRFSSEILMAMELTNSEAWRFNHEYLEPEHALLGLIKVGKGNAVDVLRLFGIDLEKVRLELEESLKSDPHSDSMGDLPSIPSMAKLPLAPAMKNVMEYAVEEARNLNHRCFGSQHILLGLLREQEGATERWNPLGVTLKDARAKICQMSEEEEYHV